MNPSTNGYPADDDNDDHGADDDAAAAAAAAVIKDQRSPLNFSPVPPSCAQLRPVAAGCGCWWGLRHI